MQGLHVILKNAFISSHIVKGRKRQGNNILTIIGASLGIFFTFQQTIARRSPYNLIGVAVAR